MLEPGDGRRALRRASSCAAQPAHPVPRRFRRPARRPDGHGADPAGEVPAGGRCRLARRCSSTWACRAGSVSSAPARHRRIPRDRGVATTRNTTTSSSRCRPAAIVTFNDPRRFGLMDLVVRASRWRRIRCWGGSARSRCRRLRRRRRSRAACRRKKVPLKVALLDQRVVAGLGNIYASEALCVARLSPKRRASTIATASGAPGPRPSGWPPRSSKC